MEQYISSHGPAVLVPREMNCDAVTAEIRAFAGLLIGSLGVGAHVSGHCQTMQLSSILRTKELVCETLGNSDGFDACCGYRESRKAICWELRHILLDACLPRTVRRD